MTSVDLTADRYTLVPESNTAATMGNRRSYADITATVSFADGKTSAMQTDARLSFSSPGGCGSFSQSGGYMRLTIATDCRNSTINVIAVATIGGVTMTASRAFSVEWLAALDLELYYQDGRTSYVSTELRYRYSCSLPAPTFHTLKAKTFGILSSGARLRVNQGVTYISVGGSISSSGGTRTLAVSAAGLVNVTVSPTSNPDGLSATRALSAVAAPDSYTFGWTLGLTANTIKSTYLGFHSTTPTLVYGSGYTETVSLADRSSLISFSSSDTTTIAVTSTGQLQALQNSEGQTATQVSAQFCDGSIVGPVDVYANLQSSTPFDYDIGVSNGLMLTYVADQASLCIPIKLYSASAVAQFQFVLRFQSNILDCSATSCGTWSPGSAWTAFGAKVGLSRDSGQVDFATVASVSSMNMAGMLDIGTLCLSVIGTGSLTLKVQMKVHMDSGGTRTCSSGSHLYQDGTRCYSRTPQVTFPVSCSSCGRRLDDSESTAASARRQMQTALPRPMNIDSSGDQLTMADCLYLTATQQELAGYPTATQTFISALDPKVAISYNPNLDFYVGTTTPVVDSQDVRVTWS